jgi:hypothetical protein
LQEYNTGKPFNRLNKNRKNGRCYTKEFGKSCTERAYGVFDGKPQCKRHYLDSVRMAKRYKNADI